MTPVPDAILQAKQRLREKMQELRSQVETDQAETSSMAVWSTLQGLPAFTDALCIGGISSFRNELDTFRILEGTLHAKKRLCLPLVSADRTRLSFHEISSLEELASGTYGIPEPPRHRHVPFDQLDLVLVPGLAFDARGDRLGFGMGFYDKTLPRLRRDCLSIGLCYSFQIVDVVPHAEYDSPVLALLTEKGFMSCC